MVRPVLKLHEVTKSYENRPVLRGLSLQVAPGECFGLLGPNGAGKTTTMKLLTGRANRDGGHIEVFGLRLPEESRRIRQRLGLVTQDDTLDEELNCIRNLTVHASFFGLSSGQARKRAETLLHFVQLGDRRDDRVTSLSGGMRRRLLIARALVNQPELVLLDEPTTGLDPQARQNLWAQIRQLGQQGATVVLTTHYMDEAEQLCDRLVIMDQGCIVAEGRPKDLVAEHAGREVIELRCRHEDAASLKNRLPLGPVDSEVHADTVYVYLKEGQPAPPELWNIPSVESFHRRATLEDVFVRITGRELRD